MNMPSQGRSRMTDTERRKIAQGKLAGKTARQIAAEVGLSESSVEKASKDPRTSLLIQRLKDRDERVLGRCWKKAVASIESHLDSDDHDLVRDARKDLLRYVTAGDPPQIKMEAPTKAASGDFTLAELLGTLRSIQAGDSSRNGCSSNVPVRSANE
jgi:hypothetical protein